jgi:hypothetical protein
VSEADYRAWEERNPSWQPMAAIRRMTDAVSGQRGQSSIVNRGQTCQRLAGFSARIDMQVDRENIETLSVEQYRRVGIACCRRLGCHRRDKRLAKAIKMLERSLGPPLNEKLRRDAYNAANSACRELRRRSELDNAIACTVLCACVKGPTKLLLGNFEKALMTGELLTAPAARDVERGILQMVLDV